MNEKTRDGDGVALSAEDESHLMSLARWALESSVGITPPGQQPAPTPLSKENLGAFVTLKVGDRLRGCIGYIEPVKSLHETILEVAEAAARHDPRFSPLTREELATLTIEISVLSPLRSIRSIEDIEIGRHGVVVEQEARRGLLLPQVAAGRGWSAVEFVEFTCGKAGLAADAWKSDDVTCYVFTATVFESSF